MANLVIVESPSKASTIKSYLGSNYKVVASKGHVRDLPKSSLGVDIENGFDAHYINIRGKGDLIKDIKKEAKNANKIFLATDPDREGEAISWHLAVALGIPMEKTMRVTFNEITKTAVKSAIKNPRQIDMDLVNAQQARRILDRIVGYKLSPFLWKNVRSGLSAGRVQSVATRIIVEREEEIRNFVPEEYWTIEAVLNDKDGNAAYNLVLRNMINGNRLVLLNRNSDGSMGPKGTQTFMMNADNVWFNLRITYKYVDASTIALEIFLNGNSIRTETVPATAGAAIDVADLTNAYIVINGNNGGGAHAINSYVAIDNVVFRKIAD